ncbi:MAG: nitrate reductase molybdenum cofactor assembly chaperone [Candidatus Obscuribacterales bacterium]|jgi:nitrate reductase delta subunit|nr:nitrate reductase molybdenum cofactor assembly chaperone [Candidatus Obscuribacterales bacterium]
MITELRRPKARALAAFADLLKYPREDYLEKCKLAKSSVEIFYPQVSQLMAVFCSKIKELSFDQTEEIFTRTFDMAPICNPYVTTYLYGDENFERGTFMTLLAQRYKESNFELTGELPDHIAVILEFAPQFDQDEFNELCEFCLKHTLGEMTNSLDQAGSIYSNLFKSLMAILDTGTPEVTKT